MDNFQNVAVALARDYDFVAPVMARYADLVSEIGELGKELLLGSNYDAAELQITNNTAEEVGDVIFALALLVNSLNLNLDECFDAAISKYKSRWKNGQK